MKPRIRKFGHIWVCFIEFDGMVLEGYGDTPKRAYANWKRARWYPVVI